MNPEMHSGNAENPHLTNIHATLNLDELVEMITQVAMVYTNLEYVIMKDGMNLCNTSKANLRRAQADIQKVRLKLLDAIQRKSERNNS